MCLFSSGIWENNYVWFFLPLIHWKGLFIWLGISPVSRTDNYLPKIRGNARWSWNQTFEKCFQMWPQGCPLHQSHGNSHTKCNLFLFYKKIRVGTFCVDKHCHTGGNIYIQLWMLPNPFGVHRNACCQMLSSKVAESISKSVSFLLLMLWQISMVVMATLHFHSKDFVWLSGVTNNDLDYV